MQNVTKGLRKMPKIANFFNSALEINILQTAFTLQDP